MLNKEQQLAVDCNDKKILCLAPAGSGKTKTLIARVDHLVNSGVLPTQILALTFTNAAANEMRERFQNSHPDMVCPEFRTFHSFAYSLICKDYQVRTALGYNTIPEIASEEFEKEIHERVIAQCKITLSRDKLAIRKDLNRAERRQLELYDKAFARLMKREDQITFDMLNREVADLFHSHHPSTDKYMNQYKYLLVDEVQDVDGTQIDFIASFNSGSNYFLTGDALQCQPAGTKIIMSDMSVKNIEDLNLGDHVLTYNCRDGHYIRKPNINIPDHSKRILGISSHYATNVVKVSSANHSSMYTKDHITYTKVHYEGNEHKYVTYLMTNDFGWWRVGSTQLFLNNSRDFGARSRMRSEHGSAVWILDVSEKANDAWITEQMVSYKYGIPQITWCHKNVRYDVEDLGSLYERLGDLSAKAEQCLCDFGRDIMYPLFVHNADINTHFSKLHQFECRVCNLIPEVFDIVIPIIYTKSNGQHKLHNSYEQIISIEFSPDQIVYGLEIEKYHNYVGDGILTHNCIYRWRGADNKYIKRLAKSEGWTKIKLLENYRSTRQICEYANNFSSTYADDSYRIAMHSDREGPEVVEYDIEGPEDYDPIDLNDIDTMIKDLTPLSGTSAILCRTNKEVIAICDYLKVHNIEYCARKETKAIKLIECALSDKFMIGYLASYLSSSKYGEYIRITTNKAPDIKGFLSMYGDNSKIASDSKKILKLREISTLLINTADKIKEVKKIFKVNIPIPEDSDLFGKDFLTYIQKSMEEIKSNELYVGTIHSVKGLEYDNVCVANVNSYCFKLGDEEMNNLFYVAITRAKNRLFVYKI